MKVLLGSNSKKSINRLVIDYLQEVSVKEIEYIDLLKEEIPIYSSQLEEELGIPKYIKLIFEEIRSSEEIIIATPEYNGYLTSFFKNIFDWLSRIDQNIFNGAKVKVLVVTPGKLAGQSVRQIMMQSLPYFGVQEVFDYGVGNFYDVVKLSENKIVSFDQKTNKELLEFINK